MQQEKMAILLGKEMQMNDEIFSVYRGLTMMGDRN